MRIVEPEEVAQNPMLNNGRETHVSSMLKQLKPGQALEVLRNEWLTKYPPTKIARRLEKQLGWQFKTGRKADNSGWWLQRVK